MSEALIIPLPGNEAFAEALSRHLPAELGHLTATAFPDGETHLAIESDVRGLSVAFVCTLAHPNENTVPLLFAADAARDLGANRVGLIAPYLAYMRQDRRFRPGEAITSRTFAKLLSQGFDWLVTVDPHLHRYRSLSEIYSVPTCIMHAAPLLSSWIKSHVSDPIIIGPDAESEQWASEIARDCRAPFTVLEKERLGDREVRERFRDTIALVNRTPVLVDDIVSTGATMLVAAQALQAYARAKPICLAVHGIFAEDAYPRLTKVFSQIVTSNSVPHLSNAIDIAPMLAESVRALIGKPFPAKP